MSKRFDLGDGYEGEIVHLNNVTHNWRITKAPAILVAGGSEATAAEAEAKMRAFVSEPAMEFFPDEVKTKEPAEPAKPKQGKLPADFPHQALLEAGGVTTYAQARKAAESGTLTDIEGIGEARAAEITEALAG